MINISAYRVLQSGLLEDWPLKFICAALAVLLWFYIDGQLPTHPEKVPRRMMLSVRPLALPGTAMSVEPDKVVVEILAEAREFADPELASRLTLYVEWPRAWDPPADPAQLLGPADAPVKAVAPPGVRVRGVNTEALPLVKVRGAAAGALK